MGLAGDAVETDCDDGQEMLEVADKDGTGSLDIIEFLQMMREKVKEQNKEKEIAEAFTVFDVVRFLTTNKRCLMCSPRMEMGT